MTLPVTYGSAPAPAPPDPMPTAPVAYPLMLRTARGTRGRGVLMVVCFVVGYLLVSTVLQGGAVGWDLVRGNVVMADVLRAKLTLTPALLLGVNLSNAACIPLSMLLQRAFFGQRGRWLHSVVGRFRWGVLGRGVLLVLPFWAAYLAISLVAAPGPVRVPTGTFLALGIIVVLTTPLQAAGEEYGTRGLLTRGTATWFASPRVALAAGTVLSAGVFTLAHGAGDPWLIGFYFLFAVVQSFVTWRSGGLELAVLLHTANNLVAFGTLVLLQQDPAAVLDRSAGSAGPAVLLPAVIMLLSSLTLWLWMSRSKINRTYEPEPPALDPETTYVGPWSATG